VRWFLPLVATALLFAACGDDEEAVPTAAAPCGSVTPEASPAGAPAVQFGETSLLVETADDPFERARGLMDRDCLNDNWGMLFVFTANVDSGFWMHNTHIPLTIAFLAADGTIIEIEDMQPETEDLHYASRSFRYAVEANQGWFAKHGIEVGDVATIPEVP
jgi:uncharacterized membrane protein (UPF0127 family)